MRGYSYIQTLPFELNNLIDIDLFGANSVYSSEIVKILNYNTNKLRSLEIQETLFTSDDCKSVFYNIETLPYLIVYNIFFEIRFKLV